MSDVIWYPGHELLQADIVRAEGAYVFDASGRRWLDLESGVWAASIGHAHPRIADALASQYSAIAHTGFNYSAQVVRKALAEVLRVLGMGDRGAGTLLCSGSEAVEYCVRLVAEFVPRPKLLTMADSYFGAYGDAHSRAKDHWTTFDWLVCPACGGGEPCDDMAGHLSSIPFDQVGAFVLEPGSSSGFVRFPPLELVQGIARRVQETGGYVIVNEVTTGVGRTGEWFGFQHYGIEPDAVALGKGIGAGYPVAVAAFGERIAARIEEPPAYAQSHQNDPLAAAILLAVVGAIEDEKLIAKGRDHGEFLRRGLEELRERTGAFTQVRGRGPTIAVDLEGGVGEAVRVHHALAEAGYFVGHRPGTATLRFDPPLVTPRADIEQFLESFSEVLAR